jgi:MinD superfamily P-loop ATPase
MGLNEIRYVISVDEGRCDACRECLPACSYGGLINVPGEKQPMIDPWACTGCGTCVTVCSRQALTLIILDPV